MLGCPFFLLPGKGVKPRKTNKQTVPKTEAGVVHPQGGYARLGHVVREVCSSALKSVLASD